MCPSGENATDVTAAECPNCGKISGLSCACAEQMQAHRMTKMTDMYLEPISKSSEEDDKASKLHETEEVVGVILPADEDAALPLYPSKEPLDEPASRVAA